ncbi:MAG: penicillin acylase family protein [Actinomycetota bacterium]
MSKRSWTAAVALWVAFGMVAASCSSDDGDDAAPPATTEVPTDSTTTTEPPSLSTTTTTTTEPPPAITEDRAYYILPPGNYGGLPTNDDSLDQLELYDGLTPLRDEISDADIDASFLPMNFEPVGDTEVLDVGRDDVTVTYDDFGVPHIVSETRAGLAFAAGWVTGRDRGLLIDFGRGPSRAAIADIPGLDAFSLVTSATPYVPSAAVEALVDEQVQLLVDTFGDEGQEIIDDAQAYADGLTAYYRSIGDDREPATVNDVIATTAFIGSIFGAGGGGEAQNSQFLAALVDRYGPEQGRAIWDDFMVTDDPEAPTTIDERFEYGTFTGGDVTGSVVVEEGSIVSFDPFNPTEGAVPELISYVVDAADDPVDRQASNWLTVSPEASTNETTLAVMGPQLGYYYPEIVMQMHLDGPGIKAQGAAVPGLAMYLLIGRTEEYAWSLTSAGQDVRDVFVEVLCEPDGSEPSRTSGHYEFEGECIPFENFDAGVIGDTPISYPVSVHGPFIGTAVWDGKPVALTRARSTFGRDSLNLKALKDMTEGDADTPENFWAVADQFGFTFNWGYANRDSIGYFASGYLPVRAEGLDRRLPTLGTGEYEWQGFLSLEEHPHAAGDPDGRLLNWNNASAPGFMHGDTNLYGSVHRVENFDQWDEEASLADVVGIMNRAATEDEDASLWPVISAVLAAGDAPSDLAADAVALIDAWIADDAPQIDGDEDGDWDQPETRIYREIIGPVLREAVDPIIGDALRDDISLRGIGLESLVDKDLRSLLGAPVDGPFNLQYCGAGVLAQCSGDLWAAVDGALQAAAVDLGTDLGAWRREGIRIGFTPFLIPDDFRATNRPTYQQVLEFAPEGAS